MIRSSRLVGVLAIACWILGCTGLQRRTQAPNSTSVGREAAEPGTKTGGPSPEMVQKETPKLGLILGPGGAKAIAHTGVIRQLAKSRVSIHGVVGLEWGALIGGLYAQKGQIHEAEWRVYKLEQKQFIDRSFFSGEVQANPVKKLTPFLNDAFGNGRLEKSAVPFACPALSLHSGTLIWQKSGSYTDALSRCLPYPPLLRASSPWVASAFSVDDAAKFLRDRGATVVVLVNVLGKGGLIRDENSVVPRQEWAVLWQELRHWMSSPHRDVDQVIEVNTGQILLDDFDRRKELVLAGEQAGETAAKILIERYRF